MVETLTLEEQREAAALFFPDQWQATFQMPGWRRRRRQANLRKAAVDRLIVSTLPAHAKCGNCKDRGERRTRQMIVCLAGSDFHGQMLVDINGRYSCWSSVQTSTPA